MTDDTPTLNELKEEHRLRTINRWDPPQGDWAAEVDWTRYRGPAPWPVPDGWVFKDPEGGGWWAYFGDAGVDAATDDDVFDAFEEDESVDDPLQALEDARGPLAYLRTETANPDEVSLRNLKDEKLEWTLEVDDTEVFSSVEPDRPDLMGAVAEALHAYHADELDERAAEIKPSTGEKPAAVREAETLEERKQGNQSLGDFS